MEKPDFSKVKTMVCESKENFVDYSKPIKGSSFTVEWLLKSLQENDKIFQKLHGDKIVKEVTYHDISDGKGFVSEILQCTLTFFNSPDSYTTILKIPGLDALLAMHSKASGGKKDLSAFASNSEMAKGIKLIHQSEIDFYQKLAPFLHIPLPLVFQCRPWLDDGEKGYIHMEDLSHRGATQTVFDSVTLEQVKAFIRVLAKMNANCLKMDPALWRGKYLQQQKQMSKIVEFSKPLVKTLVEKSGREDEFKPLLEKYQTHLQSPSFFEYAYTQAYKDQNITPVILHGDIHPGNILWKTNENNEIQPDILAIIDWHTINEGSPMFDLARFLAMCASGDIRREAEAFAIEFYHEALVGEFENDCAKIPYTVAQLKKSYYFGFLTQVIPIIGSGVFFMNALGEEKAAQNGYLEKAVIKSLMALEDGARIL